jgi:hypothetical protein
VTLRRQSVSAAVQRFFVESGFDADDILRSRSNDDKVAFERRIADNLKNATLPKSVTPDFVKKMIEDFQDYKSKLKSR